MIEGVESLVKMLEGFYREALAGIDFMEQVSNNHQNPVASRSQAIDQIRVRIEIVIAAGSGSIVCNPNMRIPSRTPIPCGTPIAIKPLTTAMAWIPITPGIFLSANG